MAEKRTVSANETIGMGFIGVGGRGQYLLRLMLTIPGVAVTALSDEDPKNLEKAAAMVVEAGQPVPALIGDWKTLLERADVEAVVSALPCDLHAACYLDTIAAGKDLYGEKPMCLTVADCDKVVAAANKADKQIVQIGFQRRADPRFIEPMEQIHAGELGTLVEGRVAWLNSWGPLYGWFGKRDRSGDWMVEQAVHNWDVMNWANDCLPVRAMGMGRAGLYADQQPDRDVHDYYTALVEYENGVIVNIIHSWISPGQAGHFNRNFNDEYTRLLGTDAGIDFNSGTFSYRRELDKPDRIGHNHPGDINGSLLSLEAFVNSVRTRSAPVATVEHGRASVLTCLLVREAVYRGGEVTMKELTA